MEAFTGTWVEAVKARRGDQAFLEALGLGWLERRAVLRATGTEETHAIRCVPPVFYLKESLGPRVHEDVLRIGSKSIIRRDIDGTGLQDVAVLLQQSEPPQGNTTALKCRVATKWGVVEERRLLSSSDTMTVQHCHLKTGVVMEKAFKRISSETPYVPRRYQADFSEPKKEGVADTQTCNDDHLFPSRNVEEGEVKKQEPVTVYRRLLTSLMMSLASVSTL